MIVEVKNLAKKVAIAEVMFQIQHPLLKKEILVDPPSGARYLTHFNHTPYFVRLAANVQRFLHTPSKSRFSIDSPWRGTGRSNPSRDITLLSGANGDWEIFIFPVRLTTSRIGNLTQLI